MSKLILRLLGTYQVELNGKTINGFSTDKARALLAYLAVERQHPHRRESLSALFWPEQIDQRARQSLRQALSNLKQELGDEDLLNISPQAVQLNPLANVWVDVGELEKLANTCDKHHHGSIENCLPCLQRQHALADLYQGDFLAGFPSKNSEYFEEWIILTRERLHLFAMNACAILAKVAEARADLPASLEFTLAQIRLEPWCEEAHRQAMRLYALSGWRSKALAQFQTCRRSLQTELAVEPTPETVTLHAAILDGTLTSSPDLPLPSRPTTSFIGRCREQAEISEHLANPDCRLITILGMGGIGKSRLALQLALSHTGLYRDGIYFVPLITASDILSAIAAELGFASPDACSRLPELLQGKEILLVLDNFEHLVETSSGLSDLLEAAPGLKIIVTSRERLRLREEWVFHLEGLPFPLELEALEARSWDSLVLFESRLGQINSNYTRSRTDLMDIASICQLVEGQPLAIEMAAGAVAESSCSEVAGSLRLTFDALSPSLRNFPKRHLSLRAVFEHSWSLLSPEQRNCLANLSVFIGGFTGEGALQIAATSAMQLAGLMAKSLVRRDPSGRYSLHESIRQFAYEKLENVAAAHASHATYYADLLSRNNGKISPEVLDMLQAERANLRAAWKWSLPQNLSVFSTLLAGLSSLYSMRGPLNEGETLFSEALHDLEGNDSSKTLSAQIAIELARLYNNQARYAQAIELARSITGHPSIRAQALLTEGQALAAQGECEAARPVLQQALALGRELGEKRIEANCLRELGNVANRLVEYAEAVPLYERSLALARELGDRRGESATLNNWASVDWDLGKLDSAHTRFLEALSLYRELGNSPGEAKALNNLSNVAADQGDLGASLQYCEQALRIHRSMGNPRGQSAALNNLGATYFILGQYALARKNYQQALDFHRESGNMQAEAETLANLSLLDCEQGFLGSGRENALQAIALAEKTGDGVNHANALYYLGRSQLAAGDHEAAENTLQHALAMRREIPHPGRLLEIQAELALLARRRSRNVQALEFLTPVLEILTDDSSLHGTDNPYRIYGLVVEILAANQDSRASAVLEKGKILLKDHAEKIGDPSLRQSFLAAHGNQVNPGSPVSKVK
jgi:predicted ATPase/DNA-binding SARP family transcriptional activator